MLNKRAVILKKIGFKWNTFKGLYAFNHGSVNLSNKPQIICLEITNACNLKCPICPMNTGKVTRKKTFMSKADFDEILEKYSGYMYKVNLSHHGESLLHPDLIYFINRLHEKNISCSITTNATLLTKELSEKLLNAGLDEIMFSFDSIDKKVYESIRSGASFDKTLNNVIEFLKLKTARKKKTHVCIRTINMDSTKDKIPAFVEYFKNIDGVDTIEINEMNSWGGRIDKSKFIREQTRGVRKERYCLQPWVTIIINSECGLFICNNHEDVSLASLKERSLEDVWNGKEYQDIRRRILDDSLEPSPICSKCDYAAIDMYSEKPNGLFPFTSRFLKYIGVSFGRDRKDAVIAFK